MITIEELLKGKDFGTLSEEVQSNLQELLTKIDEIRSIYGKPITVSSGLRSVDDHLRIYAEKGITDKSKIPMKSKHLFGQAVDIADPHKELQNWCKNNEDFLRDLGIWMEDFGATTNWVHFQIVPYGSFSEGKSLWFKP